MRKIFLLLAPGLLIAAAAAPANATVYNTSFSGTVTTATGVANAVGSTVAGSFSYDTSTSTYQSFTIGSFSASQPFSSIATTVPSGASNPYEAIFEALTASAQTGGTVNSSFTLDLLSNTNFTGTSAFSVLTNPGSLETQANSFDGNFSSFSYSYGTPTANTQSLIVALNPTSLSTTATNVPEPASMLLLAGPVLGLAFRRRR